MLRKYRRVVTGRNETGRSIVISDDTCPAWMASPDWPTRGSTSIWYIDRSPASNRDEDLPEYDKVLPGFVPAGSGGSSFMIMELPPESELDAMTPEARERSTVPVARLFPEAMEIDSSKFYGMHATDTVDVIVIVSGEVTVMMDEDEVTLRQGDTMIQRGQNHGWINRTAEPCIVAAFVVDAEPLDRPGFTRATT